MNFQNIPRKDKVVKTALLPKLDALLLIDYSQIELVLLAFYMASCGDESMADAIRNGQDLHVLTAEGVGIDRDHAKILNYMQVYGGGIGAVSASLGVPWTQAKDITRRFNATWPGIETVKAKLVERNTERGYIKTLWGRQLHLGPNEGEYVLLNKVCQGCAADLMKSAAIKVHRGIADAKSHLVNLVHDELILDVSREEIPWLAEHVPNLMKEPRIDDVVPISVDVEISFTNWADKTPYTPEMEELKAA